MSAAFDPSAQLCPDCGGPLVAGKVAVPVLGTLRFVYRLGTNEIETEVSAMMCGDCGRVLLRAKDPELIRRAERAGRLGRAAPTWGRRRWQNLTTPPDDSSDRTG